MAGENGKGTAILDGRSYWRTHFTWRTSGGKRYPKADYQSPLPPEKWAAPEFDDSGWGRCRVGSGHSRLSAYGVPYSGPLRVLCLRGKFTVVNPATAELSLTFSFRGGAVVYVNGKEVSRKHLAKGAKRDALAEEYPKEAFYLPNGKPLPAIGGTLLKHPGAKLRVRKLEGVEIPGALLRKGVNVVALEIHAAPFEEKVARRHSMVNTPTLWSPCGLVDAELRGEAGVQPNVSRPQGLQIWAVGVMERPDRTDFLDPHEKSRALEITGARNGIFCGQVVVASAGAIRGLGAKIGELKHEDGKATLPAGGVEVLYAHHRASSTSGDAFMKHPPIFTGYYQRSIFDPLAEEPPGDVPVLDTVNVKEKLTERYVERYLKGHAPGAVQPVWIKVRVPADAAPGEYGGKLTVTGNGRSMDVPVKLKVIDWRLPDAKDYVTLVGLLQSPDSVSLQYKVPMWSDEHFKYLEKSYELLVQAVAKFIWLPMLTRTNLGNSQSIVRWVKKGGNGNTRYEPDFTVFDRYMDMVQRHMKPTAVCLYAYDRYTDYAARNRATSARLAKNPDMKHRGMPGTDAWRISVVDPKTGEVTEELAPKWRKSHYDTKLIRVTREELIPEAKAFYAQALKEVRRRLEKRGLGKALLIGIEEDLGAKKSTSQFFAEILPGVRWARMCHPLIRSKHIGYNSAVYIPMMPPPRPWDAKRKTGWQYTEGMWGLFPRTHSALGTYLHTGSPPGLYRISSEGCQLIATGGRYPMQGVGRSGADFWALGAKKVRGGVTRSSSVVARYPETCWDQLNLDRVFESILAPGPEGAITTVRFENFREGVQESEARIYIEKALADPGRRVALGAALVKKCQGILDERHNRIRTLCLSSRGKGGMLWYASSGSRGLAEQLFSCAAEVARKTGAR
jgi:hypothetical protein